MNIIYLELPTKDLIAQRDYYSQVLELPVTLSVERLEVVVGKTKLVFTQATSDFEGGYHFAFNIPENQFDAAKQWLASRDRLLKDVDSKDEFESESWNSRSLYFKDAAGNVLEFIARHNLKNKAQGNFDGTQILNISEIGLPSEDVIEFANELCQKLGITVFKQKPSETFTPVGDDNGLLILPVQNRMWIPNSGVLAKLLPVNLRLEVADKTYEVRGMPYQVHTLE